MNEKTNDRIRQLRIDNKLTQAALADVMGVARMTIVNYENGRNTPDTDFLMRAAAFFNCTTDYLLEISTYRSNESRIQQEKTATSLTKSLKCFNDKKRVEFLTTIEGLLTSLYKVDNVETRDELLSNISDLLRVCGNQTEKGFDLVYASKLNKFTSGDSLAFSREGEKSTAHLAKYKENLIKMIEQKQMEIWEAQALSAGADVDKINDALLAMGKND